MVLLENDAFLTELTKLFQRSRNYGSISFTMKQFDGVAKAKSKQESGKPQPEPTDFHCLIRAKVNKSKLSTVVHTKEVNKFQLAFCNLLKGNLDGLKKLKKSKTKSKAAQ